MTEERAVKSNVHIGRAPDRVAYNLLDSIVENYKPALDDPVKFHDAANTFNSYLGAHEHDLLLTRWPGRSAPEEFRNSTRTRPLRLIESTVGQMKQAVHNSIQHVSTGSWGIDYGHFISSIAFCILAYSGVESVIQTAGLVRNWRDIRPG